MSAETLSTSLPAPLSLPEDSKYNSKTVNLVKVRERVNFVVTNGTEFIANGRIIFPIPPTSYLDIHRSYICCDIVHITNT